MGTVVLTFAECQVCGWVEPWKDGRPQECCRAPMQPLTQTLHTATRRSATLTDVRREESARREFD